MVVEFIKPDMELIRHIASNMREADQIEVWASHRHSPLQALMSGWKVSKLSAIISVNGDPCVMLGVASKTLLSDEGTPWLLGTNSAVKHARQFIDLVPPVINEMFTVYNRLSNYVHVDNLVSKRWLKRIGFELDEPEPYGITGELFHKFHLEKV